MSGDNSCSCGSSNLGDDADHWTAGRPKLLEGIGSTVLSLAHFVLRQSRQLPFLVGPVIAVVEDIVSPHVQPLAIKVESEGMHLLSLADEKLWAVGDFAMKKVPLVSVLVSNTTDLQSLFGHATTVVYSVCEKVRGRGVIGAAADNWVKYEVTLKTKSAESLKFVEKLPLLHIFVPLVYTFGTPIVSAFSSWLAKHSEFQDKHLLLHEVQLLPDERDLKDIAEEKQLYVVELECEERADTDRNLDKDAIDFADNPESSRGSNAHLVKKGDLFEVDEEKTIYDGSGKGEADVKVVAPVGFPDNEDSDDELTVLFDAGWSLGTLSPGQRILEPKTRKQGWW